MAVAVVMVEWWGTREGGVHSKTSMRALLIARSLCTSGDLRMEMTMITMMTMMAMMGTMMVVEVVAMMVTGKTNYTL
jgi:predicted phage tail protein